MGIDFRNLRRGQPFRGAAGLVSRSMHLVSQPRSNLMVSPLLSASYHITRKANYLEHGTRKVPKPA